MAVDIFCNTHGNVSCCITIDSSQEGKTTLGIFFTNCMTFTNDSAALFPTIARSNHACTPNSEFITRPTLGKQ